MTIKEIYEETRESLRKSLDDLKVGKGNGLETWGIEQKLKCIISIARKMNVELRNGN